MMDGVKQNLPITYRTGYSYMQDDGNGDEECVEVELPDELVEVAQQAALWYFTNGLNPAGNVDANGDYIVDNEMYNVYVAIDAYRNRSLGLQLSVLTSELTGAPASSDWSALVGLELEDGTRIGEMWEEQAAIICHYLIQAANDYDKYVKSLSEGAEITSPLEINSETITNLEQVTIDGTDYYVVGPIKIDKIRETVYDLNTMTVSDNAYISKQNGVREDDQTVSNYVGKEFYVTVPKSEVEGDNIKIEFKGTYNKNIKTLWLDTGTGVETEQPIVEVIPDTGEMNLEVEVPMTKRKVIKEWKDNNNQDELRPEGIKVGIYKGDTLIDTKNLPIDNKWEYTWTGLPKTKDGTDIVYTIKELKEDNTPIENNEEYNNYTTTYATSTEEGLTIIKITNTHETKIFDLALRKTIKSIVDGAGAPKAVLNETGVDATRNLTYVATDITGENTTATYKHRKDPVIVKKGDVVTYTLSIYNEGEANGYAVEIIDRLPEGLKLKGATEEGETTGTYTVEGITYNYTYNPETNIIKFTNVTKNILLAYAGGDTLSSETIEIECEVTRDPTTKNTYLTNIAYISLQHNSEIGPAEGKDVHNDIDSSTTEESSPSSKTQVRVEDSYDGYKGKETNGSVYEGTDNNYYFKGEEDDDDFEIVVLEPITDVEVEKQWEDSNDKEEKRPESIVVQLYKNDVSMGDAYKVTLGENQENGWAYKWEGLPKKENGTVIEYTVKELNSDGTPVENGGTFDNDYTVQYTKTDVEGKTSILITNTHETKIFDLALRKTIKSIVDEAGATKAVLNEQGIDATRPNPINYSTAPLKATEPDEKDTTAIYPHRKDPVIVKKGDIVTYTLSIYNEGEANGYAAEIIDKLPEGLALKGYTENGTTTGTYTVEGITYNYEYNAETNIIKFTNVSKNVLLAYAGGDTLSSETIEIECEVTREPTTKNTYLTNIAYISLEHNSEIGKENGKDVEEDIDSSTTEENSPSNETQVTVEDTYSGYKGNETNGQVYEGTDNNYHFKGKEDDDDFEIVVLEPITEVEVEKQWFDNDDQDGVRPESILVQLYKNDVNMGDEYQATLGKDQENGWTYKWEGLPKKENGQEIEYTVRELNSDGTPVENGETFDNTYTVEYIQTENEEENKTSILIKNTHTPEEISVEVIKKWEDIDNYYKTRPENLEVQLYKNGVSMGEDYRVILNEENEWTYKWEKLPKKENGQEIEYTAKELNSDKTPVEDGEKFDNSYIVKYEITKNTEGENSVQIKITNKKEIIDIALTKFITAVSEDISIDEGEYLTEDTTSKNAGSKSNPYIRATRVDSRELRDNEKCHDATYIMVKDPLLVPAQSYVLYNIRLYNEGETDMYIGEVKDYLPQYIDYVDCEFNNKYGWKVGEDGKTITTDYLSYESGIKNKLNNLLKAFDKENDDGEGSGLDYRDIQILCRVNDKAPTETKLINSAEITKYEDEDGDEVEEDIDSKPENLEDKNQEVREEDDDDYEVVIIKKFDLSLLKYVTTVYVTEDGVTRTIQTGNIGDENDIIPKVEIHRKKLDSTIVKFGYTIKITNEGEIAGEAREITDYVPEGLKFYAEDNKGWTDEGNNVISTRLLEGTVLEPKESAEVTVILRWINGSSNLGLKTNTAEISEDFNKEGIPDCDSVPDNRKPGEDDIDDASVILSISTGLANNIVMYSTSATVILAVLGVGLVLIKKYVL